MPIVRNLLFQPITVNLADQTTLHLGPRQQRPITKAQVSPELQRGITRHVLQLMDEPKTRRRKTSEAK